MAVRAVPWTTATVASDRKTVRVEFTEGQDGCNVFARAEHRRAGDRLIVTLYAGNEPGAASCDTLGPEFGIAKQVVIPLDEAAPDEIVDGGE